MRFLWFIGMAALSACGEGPAASAPAAPAPIAAPASEAPPAEKTWFISTANPHAAKAGAEVLRRGGSAVDAAIATQAVLGLVEPQSSGFGGGAFMIHYDPTLGVLETYDGREVAPAAATPDRFLTETGEPMNFYDAVVGGLSVGVPGVLRMLELAHEEHGETPWSELFEPAIALSEGGFEISPRMQGFLERIPRLKQLPAAAAYFYDANGEALPVGHLLKNPAYAETLKIVAEGGADPFYNGPIAEAIVEAVTSAPNPGDMTLADLANYRPIKRDPVCSHYRLYQICSMAPPSSGGVTTLQIMAMLEPFDMADAGSGTVNALHLIFEASRLAYADRNQYLADNEQLASEGGLSLEEVISGLLNPAYLEARAQLINPETAAIEVLAGDPSAYAIDSSSGKWSKLAKDASPEPPSTSHFVIIDGEGRVVSMTTTVEFPFGSHLMSGGMILNNQLTDFSFLPARDGAPVANAVAPGKRPRSSMSPVIAFDSDGDFWAALGSPGGPAIIGYVVKTLIAMIDWNMTAQEAIDLPNAVYPRGAPLIEEGKFTPQVLSDLAQRGHQVTERALTSGVHGVKVLENGDFDGGADPRREGVWLTGVVEKIN